MVYGTYTYNMYTLSLSLIGGGKGRTMALTVGKSIIPTSLTVLSTKIFALLIKTSKC